MQSGVSSDRANYLILKTAEPHKTKYFLVVIFEVKNCENMS